MPATPSTDRGSARRETGARRRRDDLILDALEMLLSRVPLRDLGVEQIAEESGITRTRFYYYYKSKHEAYSALLRRVTGEITAIYDVPESWFNRPPGSRPLTAMRDSVHDVVQAWMTHGAVMREGADLWNTSSESRAQWHHLLGELVSRMTTAIERERSRGVAPPGPDAAQLAYGLVWFGERLLFLALADAPDAQSIEDMIDNGTAIWMRSIYLADDPDP